MRRILFANVGLIVVVMKIITIMFGTVGAGVAHLVWYKSDAGLGSVHIDHSSQTIYLQRETHHIGKGTSSRLARSRKNVLYSTSLNAMFILLMKWKFPAQALPGKVPFGLSAASRESTDLSSDVTAPTLLWAAILTPFLGAGVLALVRALLLKQRDLADLEPIRVTLACSTTNRSQKLKKSRVQRRALHSSMCSTTVSGLTSGCSSEGSSIVYRHETSRHTNWIGNSRSSEVSHQTGNIGDSRVKELEPCLAEGHVSDLSIITDICPVSGMRYSLSIGTLPRMSSMQSDISAVSKVSCIHDHLRSLQKSQIIARRHVNRPC